RRPGYRARTLRSNGQQTEAVRPRDAATAGADLEQVEHRRLDRDPAARPEAVNAADLELPGPLRLAAQHEARLGGCAAHVEDEQVGHAGRVREPFGEDGAGCGP